MPFQDLFSAEEHSKEEIQFRSRTSRKKKVATEDIEETCDILGLMRKFYGIFWKGICEADAEMVK